jgi:WD40 repeat protein
MLVAMADQDDTIKLWDRAEEKIVATLSKHDNHINTVRFSPDGSLLVSGSWDETTRVWDTATARAVWTLPAPLKATAASFSPDGRQLAVAYQAWVQVFDLSTGRWRKLWRTEDGWLIHDSGGQYACDDAGCAHVRFRGQDNAMIDANAANVRPLKGLKRW